MPNLDTEKSCELSHVTIVRHETFGNSVLYTQPRYTAINCQRLPIYSQFIAKMSDTLPKAALYYSPLSVWSAVALMTL